MPAKYHGKIVKTDGKTREERRDFFERLGWGIGLAILPQVFFSGISVLFDVKSNFLLSLQVDEDFEPPSHSSFSLPLQHAFELGNVSLCSVVRESSRNLYTSISYFYKEVELHSCKNSAIWFNWNLQLYFTGDDAKFAPR